jgi:hypothetical protein
MKGVPRYVPYAEDVLYAISAGTERWNASMQSATTDVIAATNSEQNGWRNCLKTRGKVVINLSYSLHYRLHHRENNYGLTLN